MRQQWRGRLIAGAVGLVVAGFAQTVSAEIVKFHSAAVPPTPLKVRLAQERGETASPEPGFELTGELLRPPGNGPFPAVVMVHGCGGVAAKSDRARAERYVSWGYAALSYDSFGPRGIDNTCTAIGPTADRALDALGALAYLAQLPFIDPERIAVVGYSQGAEIALSAIDADNAASVSAHRFKAAVAYYSPGCPSEYQALTAPMLLLMGGRDDWATVHDCRAELATRTETTPSVKLVIYPEAYHDFDAVGIKGQPGTLGGHRLEYNEAADHAAAAEMRAFLEDILGR